ncbi:hypothetical protein Mag101_11805 [Microbulbifer agarilyticus]|uniref:Uncharacterized protein n=2 Tax=Microbulbifer agarilyticus TaxID=260552 RepID=A0A1Q2M6T5_9GAMM|nr:hypothetical protein Mag101_11805 [Microbulbifer agarilyticus]
MAAAVVGGTASTVSGGKFSNGAISGSFSRAFNHEVHGEGGLLERPRDLQLKDLVDSEVNLELNKGPLVINDDLDIGVDITKLAAQNLSPLSVAVDSNGQGTIALGKEIDIGVAQLDGAAIMTTDGGVGAQLTGGWKCSRYRARDSERRKTLCVDMEGVFICGIMNAKQNLQGMSE